MSNAGQLRAVDDREPHRRTETRPPARHTDAPPAPSRSEPPLEAKNWPARRHHPDATVHAEDSVAHGETGFVVLLGHDLIDERQREVGT
jgi:cell division septation protein DedD